MSDRYRLHSLRLSSPARPGSRATRPVSSVPPRPPARRTGTLLVSCWRARPHVREEQQAGVVQHRAVALRHRVQLRARYASWLDVVARHRVRRRRTGRRARRRGGPRLHVEERIEQAGDVAAEQQRGDARLVGLERQRDDVAHQPHVLADVFGQAVVGPLHRDERAVPVAWRGPRPVSLLGRMRSTRFSTSRTLVRYSSSLARSAELTCRLRPAALSCDAVEDALVAPAAAVVEQAVERQRRIDLHRHRRVGALPGDVRAVRHREVRLVVAGDRLLAPQDQARLRRVLADACWRAPGPR